MSISSSLGSKMGNIRTSSYATSGHFPRNYSRLIEVENRQLRQIAADQALVIRVPKEINSKNW